MLADVADEIEEREVLHPVVVVDHDGRVGRVAVEIEEAGKLLLDALLVVAQRLGVEQVALGRLHRRVADHSRGTAYQGHRTMAAVLQVLEHHNSYEVSYM